MFDKRAIFPLIYLIFMMIPQILSAQGPDIKFDVDTADFGVVAEGDSVIYDFWFTNVGKDSAKINQAYPACGCTYPTYTQGKIAPGARGKVHVVFHSKGFGGQTLLKEVIIINTGPERYARFKVKVVNAAFKKELEEYKKQMESSGKKNRKRKKK
ncbi:MAG: DUF1573 domain-containing protein [Chitinophagaceae bacterium]